MHTRSAYPMKFKELLVCGLSHGISLCTIHECRYTVYISIVGTYMKGVGTNVVFLML